jgi:hypothetical protein
VSHARSCVVVLLPVVTVGPGGAVAGVMDDGDTRTCSVTAAPADVSKGAMMPVLFLPLTGCGRDIYGSIARESYRPLVVVDTGQDETPAGFLVSPQRRDSQDMLLDASLRTDDIRTVPAMPLYLECDGRKLICSPISEGAWMVQVQNLQETKNSRQ